jgi:hypothetical protein
MPHLEQLGHPEQLGHQEHSQYQEHLQDQAYSERSRRAHWVRWGCRVHQGRRDAGRQAAVLCWAQEPPGPRGRAEPTAGLAEPARGQGPGQPEMGFRRVREQA